jgi:hypothetical protein
MKPKDKVVSAEDITSSLYFLHVEQPEDAQLVAFQEPNHQDDPPATSHLPPAPVVQRKAVPGASIPQEAGGYPTRKPLSGTLAPVENYANRQNVIAGSYAQQSGRLTPEYTSRRSHDQSQYQQPNKQPVPPPHRSPERHQPVGTSLTLIRRDPSSGAQWNVARINDPSMVEVCSSNAAESGAKRQMGAPMWIDVTNPGYSKFLHTEDTGKPATPTPSGNGFSRSYQAGAVPQLQVSVPYSNVVYGWRVRSIRVVVSGTTRTVLMTLTLDVRVQRVATTRGRTGLR